HPDGARRRIRAEAAANVMASLRARLMVAVLALTAVGLLLLGGITYVEQRSFELDRIDDQVRTALPVVAGALREQGTVAQPRIPPGGAPGSGLPAGTYGEQRTADGTRIASHVFDYGQEITADPLLPRNIPLGHVFTVNGENGDENSYRVFAERDVRGDSITVVA